MKKTVYFNRTCIEEKFNEETFLWMNYVPIEITRIKIHLEGGCRKIMTMTIAPIEKIKSVS